VQCFSRKCCG